MEDTYGDNGWPAPGTGCVNCGEPYAPGTGVVVYGGIVCPACWRDGDPDD